MAMIVDALASQFAETLADLIKEEVSMLLEVKDEIQRLEEKVGMIRTVLEDAEHEAFTNSTIRSWLADLKDILYDADDVIDHCRIHSEKLTRLSLEQSSLPISVRCYSPFLSCFRRVAFHHQIGSRVRSINDRLERIIKDKSYFDLSAAARDDRGSSRIHRQTTPGLEPDISGMGIMNDTNNLVDLLMDESAPTISIIAIVGMGGIGKTTLAQNIYNHQTIRYYFQMPPPMWVCVSQNYSETNLMKEIIRCAGGDLGNAQSLGELEPILSRLIGQKKFFLILDDVWSARVWEHLLRKPLHRGAAGSRVLITTRDEHVAKQMGAAYLHRVQPLSTEDSWSLFHKMVFREGEGGFDTAWDIGKQIVEKCHGLPLALKIIAGVLRTKAKSQREWSKVLQNPAWLLTDLPEGVMPVLYLSYEDLPFHLKQCFIYCSLFPEDCVLLRDTLIEQWIAEGFVKVDGDMIMEDVAQGYYEDLLARSLLQLDHLRSYGEACKVHDLHRSLAQFLARDEYFVGDVKGLLKSTSSSSTKLRHLSVVDMALISVPEVVKKQKFLRTLLFMSNSLIKDVPQDIFEKLGSLRVLDFSDSGLFGIPESLGNLIHLRYLNLSGSSMVELPETIASLRNLQYLILQRCKYLKSLPKGIAKLYNMRRLDLLYTPVSGMPKGIGRMQHLNSLVGFMTNEGTESNRGSQEKEQRGGWCSLEELSSLSQLRTLAIMNLERALTSTKARGFLLKDKINLTTIHLSCTPMRADGQPHWEEELKKVQEVFDKLFPPPSLELCKVDGYFGLQCPSWMMPNNIILLFNLRQFELTDWLNCRHLPPLGLLPNLNSLQIQGFAAVESIGLEFMGLSVRDTRWGAQSYVPFPKLEVLNAISMPNLVQWVWGVEDGAMAMPRLRSLLIFNCPKLRSLPDGLHQLTALEFLSITGANSLSAVENFSNFKCTVNLQNNPKLKRFSNFPSIRVLHIESCLALREVEGLPSLQILVFEDLEMEFLPEWLLLREGSQSPFPVLKQVSITVGGLGVLRRCLVGCPDWPKIQHLSLVHIQLKDRPEFVFYNKNTLPSYFITEGDTGGGGFLFSNLDAGGSGGFLIRTYLDTGGGGRDGSGDESADANHI